MPHVGRLLLRIPNDDDQSDVVVLRRVAYESANLRHQSILYLLSGTPSVSAHCLQQPLVAKETPVFIFGIRYAVRIQYEYIVRR